MSINKHWYKHAQKWELVKSPLKPCKDDILNFNSSIKYNNPSTLLLGSTSELNTLSSDLTIVDSNQSMLNNFSNKYVNKIYANWVNMNLPSKEFQYIIGDGSFNVIDYKKDLPTLLANLKNHLAEDGTIITRIFISPDIKEETDNVITQALNHKISNFSAFKWHFAMSLIKESNAPNIKVADIYSKFKEHITDYQKLSDQTGWPLEEIMAIEHYKNSDSIYNFPTLVEISSTIEKLFNITSIKYGNYYLAERCPVIAFGPK